MFIYFCEICGLGEYREGLIIYIQRKIQDINGVFILQNPPGELIEYWSLVMNIQIDSLPCIVITSTDDSSLQKLLNHKNNDKGVDAYKIKFPYHSNCPMCKQRVKFNNTKKGKCPECKIVIFIDEYGRVFLG